MRNRLSFPALIVLVTFAWLPCGAQFVEIAEEAGIYFLPNINDYLGGGCAWFDYNNDGWDDLYVTGGTGMDRLYRNDGQGGFVDVSDGSGLELTSTKNTMGVSTGDVDNDGDQDIFVTTWRSTTGPNLTNCMLFINQGSGLFFDVAEDVGITQEGFCITGAIFDANGDGWLDLYAGNYVSSPSFILEDGIIVGFDHTCFEDWIYINNQDGTFTESSELLGVLNDGCTLALAASDYDRDGDTDLMIVNDFGTWVEPNKAFQNEGTTNWSDVSVATNWDHEIYGMGVATGDFDEDLDLDYYMTNLGENILLKQDAGQFEDVAQQLGISNGQNGDALATGWGTFFFDCNNDSYLDLFVCNGHIPTIQFIENAVHDSNKLYLGDSQFEFEDASELYNVADTLIGRGCAYSDYDKDGDLDFAVVNIPNNVTSPEGQNFRLYRNENSDGNWCILTLQGTWSNPNAIGSQVELYSEGRAFLREVTGGGSHASQNSYLLHFGLGELAEIDSAQIGWPDGQSQIVFPEINTYNHYIEGEIITDVLSYTPTVKIFPNPTTESFVVTLDRDFNAAGVKVFDSRGRTIEVSIITHSPRKMEVVFASHLASGMYVFQVSSGSKRVPIVLIRD